MLRSMLTSMEEIDNRRRMDQGGGQISTQLSTLLDDNSLDLLSLEWMLNLLNELHHDGASLPPSTQTAMTKLSPAAPIFLRSEARIFPTSSPNQTARWLNMLLVCTAQGCRVVVVGIVDWFVSLFGNCWTCWLSGSSLCLHLCHLLLVTLQDSACMLLLVTLCT